MTKKKPSRHEMAARRMAAKFAELAANPEAAKLREAARAFALNFGEPTNETKTNAIGKVRHVAKIDSLVDQIKDHVDRLHEIASPDRRREAARDLLEYIQLHHLDGQ